MSVRNEHLGKMTDDKDWITSDEIPDPSPPPCPGWQIIVRPVGIANKTRSGLILTDQTVADAKYLTTVGKVLSVGALAFMDEQVFGKDPEPWCKVGDYIAYRKLAGQKFWWEKVQLVIMNDKDMIMGPFRKDQLANLLHY